MCCSIGWFLVVLLSREKCGRLFNMKHLSFQSDSTSVVYRYRGQCFLSLSGETFRSTESNGNVAFLWFSFDSLPFQTCFDDSKATVHYGCGDLGLGMVAVHLLSTVVDKRQDLRSSGSDWDEGKGI
jgi:hypothetical protein